MYETIGTLTVAHPLLSDLLMALVIGLGSYWLVGRLADPPFRYSHVKPSLHDVMYLGVNGELDECPSEIVAKVEEERRRQALAAAATSDWNSGRDLSHVVTPFRRVS